MKLILPPGDFLVGAGDDEVSVIHGDQVGCELAWEVVLILELLPVYIRTRVFCFFQCVGDRTLEMKAWEVMIHREVFYKRCK